MGDRFLLQMTCPKCQFIDDDVYFAPTCGCVDWKCPECGEKVDLIKHTGITKEAASNREEIREIMNKIAGV